MSRPPVGPTVGGSSTLAPNRRRQPPLASSERQIAEYALGPHGARVGRRAAEGRGQRRTESSGLRRIVFVDVSVQLIFHAVVMMSLWLLFAGHNQPGGGFVGGLLAGSAITLRYIAGGMAELRQRSLSRIIIDLGLLTHGANVLLITAGRRGTPPIVGQGQTDAFSDPLPQTLALTAIVITFAVTVLLLALAYRSWLLTHDDEVEDDVGDRAVARSTPVDEEVADQREAMDATIHTRQDVGR